MITFPSCGLHSSPQYNNVDCYHHFRITHWLNLECGSDVFIWNFGHHLEKSTQHHNPEEHTQNSQCYENLSTPTVQHYVVSTVETLYDLRFSWWWLWRWLSSVTTLLNNLLSINTVEETCNESGWHVGNHFDSNLYSGTTPPRGRNNNYLWDNLCRRTCEMQVWLHGYGIPLQSWQAGMYTSVSGLQQKGFWWRICAVTVKMVIQAIGVLPTKEHCSTEAVPIWLRHRRTKKEEHGKKIRDLLISSCCSVIQTSSSLNNLQCGSIFQACPLEHTLRTNAT
jgi:hypothetical protein